MIKNATNFEYFLIRKTAEKYRREGYEVSLDPLLNFMPGFQPDLIVRKGDEVKVIEVKSRSSLAADRRIAELARFIDSKPGWSFELVLVSEPEKLDSPEGARSFVGKETLRRMEEAEKSLQAGFHEAAFLLAWSACEAAIRELIEEQGVSNPSITRPGYVLDQAIHVGVISRDEYNYLTNMQRYRNAIVHGFTVSDFGEEEVRGLIETVRRIVTNGTPSNYDSDQSP